MVILGIDPGKTTGLAVLQTRPEPRVLWCGEADNIVDTLRFDAMGTRDKPNITRWNIAVYERVQSYGAGLAGSLVDTAEIGGYCRHALGAVPMTRPEVIRTLGLTGRGISKSAVWGEVKRVLGSDKGGKLCPRRNRKDHDRAQASKGLNVFTGFVCAVCYGSGYERAPGPLAMFRGSTHARDALAVALAYALREGLLWKT